MVAIVTAQLACGVHRRRWVWYWRIGQLSWVVVVRVWHKASLYVVSANWKRFHGKLMCEKGSPSIDRDI